MKSALALILAAALPAAAAPPTLKDLFDAARGEHQVYVKQLTETGQIGEMGGGVMVPPRDSMTPLERLRIMNELAESRAKLEAAGKLSRTHQKAITNFGWPLRQGAGRTDFNYHGVSNFVDENPAFPGQILDYNCGNRSYDLDSGYNHKGTDIFNWPYTWNKMDNEDVVIVSGAPGTILSKFDGNFDRNCALGSGQWNAVYIQHADGSVAWYGHMKSGSTTVKSVGETVAAGEYLGVVGSSGSSTGPHLHLELYDSGNALVDPWTGACNSMSKQVTFAQQRPYWDLGVNAITVGTAVVNLNPDAGVCNEQALSFASDYIAPGTVAYFTIFLRDQTPADIATVRWYQPNGTLWQSSNHSAPSGNFSASYWWWSRTMPASPTGLWRFEVTIQGQVYSKTFNLGGSPNFGAPTAIAVSGGDRQSTTPGSGFTAPLVATVTDAQGRPVPNAKVGFAVPASGATTVLASRNAITNASGQAIVSAIANNASGAYAVNATVAGAAAPAVFVLSQVANPGGDTDGDGIPNGIEPMEARNAAVKDNDVFANARLFSMQQYRDFLSREGDSGGIGYWVNLLGTGTTRAQAIQGFFGSPEFQGVIAPVARLYFAYFLRYPDYGGLQFHVARSRTGTALATISNDFAGSPEFVSRYGALSNDAFIELVYQNVLGRPSDPGGKAYWLAQMSGGATRGTVMLGFSDSPEYVAAIGNEVFVTMMYVGMLRRAPDGVGFTYWVSQMDGGTSGLNLTNGFLAAPEYRNRFLPP